MNPIVYLQEEQISALFESNNKKPTKGFAYCMDNSTVIHAFTKMPKVSPPGQYLDTWFIFAKSLQDFEKSSCKDITHIGLVVFFVLDNKILKSKARLVMEEIAQVSEQDCIVKYIPEKSDLYSRSKGLLETDVLAKKTVGIVGLGSGGSPIATELAKAGIGKFVLIDFDRLELSNVARHICGINDLGRYKTFAVGDFILQKNPHAEITTLEIDVNQYRDECSNALSKVDLIICASDNDRSRFFLNEIALKYKIPAIFGRAITRAVGGDVLRVRPYKGPCYSCLYSQNIRQEGSDDEEISQEKQAKKLFPDYTNENDIKTVIQVGLASDIAPITNFMVKLALVELSRGLDSGIKSLEEDLVADFYIWANRRENIYENWNKLEYTFNKPTILRWYGAKVIRDPNCMVCNI